MENSEFNLEERVLCQDEACIGVVGPDGCCKECGLKYDGELPTISREDNAFLPEEAIPGQDETDLDESVDDTESPEDRICCPDDACIGIIGPDGRCGTCGKTKNGERE